uniref:Uncharacterized protein n=1 Tax=Aegilops tauschii subsp. strangulata TaxID=200361 RepID=A0A452YGL1_AEGTS
MLLFWQAVRSKDTLVFLWNEQVHHVVCHLKMFQHREAKSSGRCGIKTIHSSYLI